MENPIDWKSVAPEAMRAMLVLEGYVRGCRLEPGLVHLVKLRASQMNGCAYCVDMHSKDARAAGESEQRLHLLSVWRETPFFTERERAALAWTEAVTAIAGNPPSDELLAETRRHFADAELVDLTMAIVAINGWNRLAIPFRAPVGTYEPAPRVASAG